METDLEVKVYTDGSCTNGKEQSIGAWVAIIFINGQKVVLSDVIAGTTHNRMELLAIINAVEYIRKNSSLPIVVYTDSQYAVQLLTRKEKLKAKSYRTNQNLPIQNSDLVMKLIQLLESHSLKIIKVKAHLKKGESPNYNRDADLLARKLVREKNNS